MLVLLDRDGVINVDIPTGVHHWEEFVFIPEALEALALFKKHAVSVAIVSNQSVIGKGLCSEEELSDIHSRMCQEIEAHGGTIDRIYYCPDHPEHPTEFRKPNSGMLEQALADFGMKAEDTPMIGDAIRDLEAAARLGCPRYLVKTGKGKAVAKEAFAEHLKPVKVFENILEAAKHIIITGS